MREGINVMSAWYSHTGMQEKPKTNDLKIDRLLSDGPVLPRIWGL